MRRKLSMRLFVLSILFAALLPSSPASAEDAKQELKELQQKIQTQKKKLIKIEKLESSVLSDLEKTNSEIMGVENNLRKQRSLLAETEKKTSAVKGEVSVLEARLGKRKDWMKRKLRAVYRYGRVGDVILLVNSAENISQLMRRLEYLQRLAKYENKIIEGFKADLSALTDKQKSLDSLYAKLRRQEAGIKKTAETLSIKKTQKEDILASAKREKASYEQLINEMEAASERLIDVIRKSEESEVLSGDFRLQKGKLGWPVKGSLAIPYGRQKDSQFDTTIFRNGIYISTAAGASAKSIYSGKVVFAEWFKGYGQLVIVNHGDGYHSLYANLSEIFLSVGDIIKEDTDIGRVGESVMLNTPSLYFEIRYKGKPLDPAQWLGKR
ncbi:MAG: peptidoglycan DD-metalloendopeptidase family protein [Thermodesulfovibrionales bacterium]|nr:peptidoglycan DD-metalloendopeptidase family protein [Thermodesulfovibrionales bacterium]